MVTIGAMSNGHRVRLARETMRYGNNQLATLNREPVREPEPKPLGREPRKRTATIDHPARARAMTIEDPMTTQLLAAIARSPDAAEIADELVDEALEAVDAL